MSLHNTRLTFDRIAHAHGCAYCKRRILSRFRGKACEDAGTNRGKSRFFAWTFWIKGASGSCEDAWMFFPGLTWWNLPLHPFNLIFIIKPRIDFSPSKCWSVDMWTMCGHSDIRKLQCSITYSFYYEEGNDEPQEPKVQRCRAFTHYKSRGDQP